MSFSEPIEHARVHKIDTNAKNRLYIVICNHRLNCNKIQWWHRMLLVPATRHCRQRGRVEVTTPHFCASAHCESKFALKNSILKKEKEEKKTLWWAKYYLPGKPLFLKASKCQSKISMWLAKFIKLENRQSFQLQGWDEEIKTPNSYVVEYKRKGYLGWELNSIFQDRPIALLKSSLPLCI